MRTILKSLFIIFTLLILHFITISQVYWLQHPSPTQKKLTKSHFVDSLYGWVIGDSGTVINTTDGGLNWSVQTSGVHSSELKDLSFINRNTGWILSFDSTYKSFIIKTTNSGNTWIKTYFPDTTTILNTIFFYDNDTGYVSGFSGEIYKTSDAGNTWKKCYIDTTGCLYLFPKEDILFINNLTGYAVGGVLDLQGIFVKTTNAGTSWFSYCVAAEPLRMVLYRGNGSIALMGGDYDLGSIYAVSSNSGNNWSYEQTGCWGNATGFSFRTPAEVWAALNFSGAFAVNLDSMKPGTRWTCINSPGNVEINDVKFLSETIGYAFGDRGTILKYNENIIGINPAGSNIPNKTELYQNYPNPFNPVTVIKFYIHEPAVAEIKIFDVTGKEVMNINMGYLLNGYYNRNINLSHLPSAVYFYRLITGDISLSKKMVLTK
ncbi:MAG: cyanophycinase-like protein [Chlorobi bacterium OLB5]|nr:MAG: cyanophycinase-like protein [Chlorobi bacterium OLB5]